ncbi:ComEC/Rec2 family competence protein [Candidatus Peregrinibacteria bacterium]|nr:ComEC/Rec2 family competence protein [Candidatus Peregrinibacteria bacterium]
MLIVLIAVFGFVSGLILKLWLNFASTYFFYLAPLIFIRKLYLFVFCAALVLGVWRVEKFEKAFPTHLPFGQNIEIRGIVSDEVDKRADYQNVYFATDIGKILVKADRFDNIKYGDIFLIEGDLEEPSEEADFSYKKYLARYGVFAIIKKPRLKFLGVEDSNFRRLYLFKEGILNKINALYAEPEAGFASGLLLGSRKGMSQEVGDAFKTVGLTHIVAISGYNISLIIVMVFALFSFVTLRLRVIFSSLFIVFFIFLVGPSAAVVRAGLMGTLSLWALYGGRRSQVYFALIWSGLIMAVENPYVLFYDAGFQLSFASTFGLLTFSPVFDKYFPAMKWKPVREALILTLSAQAATLPIIALSFGRFSLISPLANLLAAPLIPPAMLFGGLSLVFGASAALPAAFFLKIIIIIAVALAGVPFAAVDLKFGTAEFISSYVLMAIFLLKFYRPQLGRAFRLEEFFCKLDKSASRTRAKLREFRF